jgi:hypothetical protein
MKSIALILIPVALQMPAVAQTTPAAHVSNTFQFVVQAPLERAAPLFGAEGERCWAGKHWDPKFLYPQPVRDVPGAVFTVRHGPHDSVWVNTVFDLTAGRMQYVAFIPDSLVSTVEVHLTAAGPRTTNATVTWTRTALDAALNDDVAAMGKQDEESGPDWQRSIASCLAAPSVRKDESSPNGR